MKYLLDAYPHPSVNREIELRIKNIDSSRLLLKIARVCPEIMIKYINTISDKFLKKEVLKTISENYATTSEEFAECSICLEILCLPVELSCRHRFCGPCIYEYKSRGGILCPMCRHPFNSIVVDTEYNNKVMKYKRELLLNKLADDKFGAIYNGIRILTKYTENKILNEFNVCVKGVTLTIITYDMINVYIENRERKLSLSLNTNHLNEKIFSKYMEALVDAKVIKKTLHIHNKAEKLLADYPTVKYSSYYESLVFSEAQYIYTFPRGFLYISDVKTVLQQIVDKVNTK